MEGSVANYSTTYDLYNAPDWMLPMIRIVPVIHFLNGYESLNPNVYAEVFQTWKKRASDTYELTIEIYATATVVDDDTEEILDIPFLLDLDLVIVNERNYLPQQTDGS